MERQATQSNRLRGEMAMTNMPNSKDQTAQAAQRSDSRIVAAAAGFLIFLGVMMQLGDLANTKLVAETAWLAPRVAWTLMDTVVACINSPSAQLTINFWPLVMMIVGGVLLVAKNSNPRNRQRGL